MRIRTTIIGLLITLHSGALWAAPRWVEFTSAEGGYSLQLPAQPDHQREVRSSFVGDVVTHTYRANLDLCLYTTSVTEVPAIAVNIARSQMFSQARDGMLEDAHGELVSFRKVERGEHPARELIYTIAAGEGKPARRGKSLFVLVGNKLIVVDVRLPQDGSKDKDGERVFSSLKTD